MPPPGSGVTFVMPVLNEAAYLEQAVASVLAQRLEGPCELILALGPSTDGTTQAARRLADADSRIRLVDNPDADIPVGLNRAIAAAVYPTIVRVDAHSELDPTYTRRALRVLAAHRAANVGGVMRAAGRTAFQRAVARAYNSPVGLGGGAYHGGSTAGPAESAYLGVMRRAVLDEVGGFDETVRRGEDWEVNLRIRRAGYLVWFDPDLSTVYWPRESWSRLVRQFYATGVWRGELVRRLGRRNSMRFFAPPALVLTVGAAAVTAILQFAGVLAGVWSWVLSIVYLPVAAYVALVAVATLRPPPAAPRERAWFAAVLPSMHLAWGTGFLRGLLRGAGTAVDTSRLTRNTPLP